jgi:hypothetical protein
MSGPGLALISSWMNGSPISRPGIEDRNFGCEDPAGCGADQAPVSSSPLSSSISVPVRVS